ncbi:MAG: haloacid dehalogenase type II [Acidimicrobiales bacterium]
MASVAVFDINETTLDLAPVRDVVDELLKRDGGFRAWFGRLLQTSMAMTATGRYEDFGALAKAALDSIGQSEGTTVPAGGWDRLAAAMAGLAPHPDVEAGLSRLAEQGWRLVALTNSGQPSVDAQLTNAGLHDRFEAVLSVDSVRAFKPAPAPYRFAVETVGVPPGETVMVAAHDWDLAGAKAIGMKTAFVARPLMPFATVYPPPDHRVTDFVELAAVLDRAT